LVDWKKEVKNFLGVSGSAALTIIVLFLKPEVLPALIKGLVGATVGGTVTLFALLKTEIPEIFSFSIALVISLVIFLYQYLYNNSNWSNDDEEPLLLFPSSNGG